MRLAKSLNDWLLGKGTEFFMHSDCESLYKDYVRWAKKHKPKLLRPSYENFINEICDALNIGVIIRFDKWKTGTNDKTFYEAFDSASYHYHEPQSQKNYYYAWLDAYDRYFNWPRCAAMDNAAEQFDKDNADLKAYFKNKIEGDDTNKRTANFDRMDKYSQRYKWGY